MIVDIKKRSLSEQIKFISNYRSCSIKSLGEKFNQRCDTNYSPQSFSRKLNKGNFNFEELKTLGEILGFSVEFKILDIK